MVRTCIALLDIINVTDVYAAMALHRYLNHGNVLLITLQRCAVVGNS